MSEQEKFDDLLRSKLEERDFPFDETNWDKAEAVIERSEKRRRFGSIAFVFSAGIMIGAGLMYFFNPNSSSPAPLAIQQTTQNNSAIAQTNTVSATQQSNQPIDGTDTSVSTSISNSQHQPV